MRLEDAQIPEIYPARANRRKKVTREEIAIEFTRKSIHLLIAFVPFLLSISKSGTIILLSAGTAGYAIFEALRMNGITIPFVSALTVRAARLRDAGRFVTGPVTLGLGALISVLLFDIPAASVAIYILAFGDSFSSLVGKTLGKYQIPFTKGKSVEGSLTCFAASMLSALVVTGKPGESLIIAIIATFVEAIPAKDWDNIILPLATGIAASLLGV